MRGGHHAEVDKLDNHQVRKHIELLFKAVWPYRLRLCIGLACLVLAKVSAILIPVTLKFLVDGLSTTENQLQGMTAVMVGLLIAFGLLRFSTTLFNELRNLVFARAGHRVVRALSLQVFEKLFTLSLRFHLNRKTGGVSRDIERGSSSINRLLFFLVFTITPTVFELLVILGILWWSYSATYSLVTSFAILTFVSFTYRITKWRTKFRVRMNRCETEANAISVDALINYETVKYFSNERFERDNYDAHLQRWEDAAVKSESSLALLNCGQGLIVALGIVVILYLAIGDTLAGTISIGDFVMINAFMIQLYLPLNFLGSTFREIQHCLTDISRMFSLLDEKNEVCDTPWALPLKIDHAPAIEFANVSFAYGPDRKILKDISFTIPAGHKLALVGISGAGKSTVCRLLYRFYDLDSGSIYVNGQDIRNVTIESLRQVIGVVPQDTVLFNGTLEENIRYGDVECSKEQLVNAVRHAHLQNFIESLPHGYETMVGERGLKLSGGERQRVAIARTLLKNPPILILDEATSSLDSKSESHIQNALNEIAATRTTLVIAHRLSTIVDAEKILVLENNSIIESGTHNNLLALNGRYANLWNKQKAESYSGTH